MKTNIVTETEAQRWSLRYDAENLAAHIPGAVVATKPDPAADVNLFVNYALYEPVDTITSALFTHREFDGLLRSRFDEVAEQVNWCFAMCQNTLRKLPYWKASVLTVWPGPQFYRDGPLVVGVCGRDYKSGRKRMHWVDELRALPGVEVRTTGGKVAWGDLPVWYDSLDYLVVISENEGGPKRVVEALARGVPVIAPDVGYCWEFPVIRYDTKEELLDIVRRLVMPGDGWARTGAHVCEVHERLLRWKGE